MNLTPNLWGAACGFIGLLIVAHGLGRRRPAPPFTQTDDSEATARIPDAGATWGILIAGAMLTLYGLWRM